MGALTKIISEIGLDYEREVNQAELEYFKNFAEPGDIILCFKPWQLGSLFIPGDLDHVGMFTGVNIIDARVNEGVSQHNVKTFLKGYSRYSVFRNPALRDDQKSDLIIEALLYEGRKYDPNYMMGAEKVYCSEYIYHVYKKITGQEPVEISKFLTKELIYPIDFKESSLWNNMYNFETKVSLWKDYFLPKVA